MPGRVSVHEVRGAIIITNHRHLLSLWPLGSPVKEQGRGELLQRSREADPLGVDGAAPRAGRAGADHGPVSAMPRPTQAGEQMGKPDSQLLEEEKGAKRRQGIIN